VLDAGTDAQGRQLHVMRVMLSPPSHAHADGSPALDGQCARFEWVLVMQRGARWSARPLVQICNDGYGARGMGEDTVVVTENRFTHTRVGGSAWGWSESTTLSLSPLAVVAHEDNGYWSLGPNVMSRSVDYQTLASTGRWWAPMCGEDENAEVDHEIAWIAIPRVVLGTVELEALRDGRTSLGTCAALVDGTSLDGQVLAGAAEPASATLRTLWPLRGPLIVEVHDDVVTEGDRLEIWVGGERPSYMTHCRAPSEQRPARGASIAITDGAVAEIGGSSFAPTVHRASDSTPRFFIELPDDVQTLTLVYADDDGSGVVRRISSSTLDVDDAASLGESAAIPGGSCVIESGALSPEVDTRVRERGPVIGP
jgi:hypothetical protein